jgi:DNA repair photolyase
MTKRNVENSVQTLKKLRDTHHCQLDISVVTELNEVIAELEEFGSQHDEEQRQAIGLRALQVLGVVISVVSNIKDLMK